MTDDPSWTEQLDAYAGATGAVLALIFGIVTVIVSVRSLRLSRRAWKTAAEALEVSKTAAAAAERAADAAAISAREAKRISAIEATRHHDELGPEVSVVFVWRPSRTGGSIFAEVTNNGLHDFWVSGAHLIGDNTIMPLQNGPLPAGATLDIFIRQLRFEQVSGVNDSPEQWPVNRSLYVRTPTVQNLLDKAFHEARQNIGRLELRFRATSEPCQCGRTSPESESHWISHREISSVSL